MTSREKFEAWMTAEQWFHGSDFEWDERRNCYAQFGIHLAYKAFLAAEGAAEQKLTDMAVQLANAESKCRELASENAVKQEFIKTCFRAAADGASMDGADIQELGERLGLFGRETYQPVLHGYICGHEAGEDTVYVMKKTPATDAFLAEVRAQGVEMFAAHQSQVANEKMGEGNIDLSLRFRGMSDQASRFAAILRKGAAL